MNKTLNIKAEQIIFISWGVLGVLSSHLNMRIFLSYLHTRDLETYSWAQFGHLLNMSLCDNSRAI